MGDHIIPQLCSLYKASINYKTMAKLTAPKYQDEIAGCNNELRQVSGAIIGMSNSIKQK